MAKRLGFNIDFPIYNADGTPFQNLVLHKATYDSVVMSLGDKITGDVYYKDNTLAVTMQEYIEYKRNPDDENELPVRFVLVNPPTIVREGMASDNGELKGMTKYSFEFYHPMCMLANFPFTDVAVESGQGRYLSESKNFSWTGTGFDFIAKINKNLQGTEWVVVPSKNAQSRANLSLLPDKVIHVKSEEKESNMVLSFDKNFVSDALKTAYDTWEVPFVVDALKQGEYTYTDPNNNVIDYYDEGKRFVVVFGLPNDEILDSNDTPYVFRYGQGVGLKNNSRTPKNNKIVTRIVGYGSENNIPYGYPQIVWNGEDDDPRLQYPIYKGIVGGQYVKLIKHPFTRKTLMPSIYAETVNKKVNPLATGYDPDIEIKDYYDADNTYDNPINVNSPSVAIHQFEDIKPQLGQKAIAGVSAYDEEKADYITEADFRAFINTTVPTRSALTQLHVGEMMYAYNLGESDKRGFVGGSQTYEWELTFDGDFCSVFYNSPDFYYKALVLVQGGSPAIERDDTMNDDGEYVQSYFKLTLPNTLDFDLYACAAITQEMKINMRSGDCIGCTFNVQVDWDDYKKNFYDTDGNFDPVIGEGHPRNADKYPNSYHNSITLVVQKDIDTFGRIMPNTYQQPKVGDEFVILGISLPLSYITNAQVALDNAMKDYMRGNNVYYYEYPLKFDEHFLATHTDILAQIRNNVKLRFGYGNEVLTLYVKQMSVKYGNAPLPQYDITLTDDVEVVMNAIGQVAEYAGRTRTQLDELQRTYGDDIVQRINEKLSRVADDIAEGRITFQQGLVAIGNVIFNDELRSPDFESGLYSGKGWRIDKLGNAEMESLRVRSYLEVVELLINRLQAQEGDTVFTDNDQIEHVEEKEYNATTYYVLSLKEKWQGYFTSQQKDNILKGIINTLAANYGNVSDITEEQCVETDGTNKYYTSWMKVIDPSDVGETLGRNQIAVILYEDTKTPANKNFPPCELMTIARWGCDAEPDDETLTDAERQSIIRRQSVFSISTSDGRIAKLRGVRTPILQNVNYGTTLGTIPDFIKQWSIYSRLNKDCDYLYAQGVIVSDFIKVDSVGRPITNYVDAGQWQNNTPYLHNAYNEQNAQWETNDVWHNGAYWRCLVTQPYNGVYYEPTDANPNHLYWQKLLTSGANGQDGTDGEDGTSVVMSGEARTTNTIDPNYRTNYFADGDTVLLTDRTGHGSYAIDVYNEADDEWVENRLAIGTCYTCEADGHLYYWNSETWRDNGRIVGNDGSDGIDGVDGENALTLALDTYAIAFPTDSDYNVGSALPYTVGVKMFLGNNAQQTITSLTATSSDGDVGTSGTSPANGVKITIDEGRFVNAVHITVTATCAKGSRTAKITLTAAPKGAKGDDGQDGQDGQDGARGKIGRFFYFAGTFNSSNTSDRFLVNDAQAPYFEHTVDGQKRYHVFNYETNGSYTMSQMWSISSGSWNNSPWEAMTNDFKYLITEAMFAEYAKLGSAVFSGDWMISQQGKIEGRTLSSITAYMVGSTVSPYTVTIKPYTLFDANHPLGGVASKNTYPTTILSSETSHNVVGNSGRKAGVLYKVTSRVDGTFSGTPLRFQIDKNGVYDPITLFTITEEETDYTAYFMVPENTKYRFRLVRDSTTTQNEKIISVVEQVCFETQYAVDLLTGKSYFSNAYVKGSVVHPTLVIDINNYTTYRVDEDAKSYLQLSNVTETNIYIYYFPTISYAYEGNTKYNLAYVALPEITEEMIGKEITICNASIIDGRYTDQFAMELRIGSHGTISGSGITPDLKNPNGLLVTQLCMPMQWGGAVPSYRIEDNALKVPLQHEVRLRAANKDMWVAVGAPYSIIGE